MEYILKNKKLYTMYIGDVIFYFFISIFCNSERGRCGIRNEFITTIYNYLIEPIMTFIVHKSRKILWRIVCNNRR